jgi:glutathione S-transferase
MSIKLQGLWLSNNVRAIATFCELNGIAYEYEEVNILKGEHKTPEYLAKNPLGQIPAIVDGDFGLGET